MSIREELLQDHINMLIDDLRKAERKVERLTKAGDVMISEWASGEEKDAENFLKALVIWNAAKDGKPRA